MPLQSVRLDIPDLLLIKPPLFRDERGFFLEMYKKSDYETIGIKDEFVQFNHSKSQKGVLRGLHYQLNPRAQGKMIRVLKGSIYDVALDIRKGSPHYGRWCAVTLDSNAYEMLYVPKGFAHGFLAMEDNTEIEYFCTDIYSPSDERGIRYDDPSLSIPWPIKSGISVSKKDSLNPLFKDADNNFSYGSR